MQTDSLHLYTNVSHSLTTPYDGSSLSCLYSLRSCCVCACLCEWCSHILFLIFYIPPCTCTAGSRFMCEFLYFRGFMHVCLRDVLSFHVPPCICSFLCICVWLQIVVCFDVYVCMSMNYVKCNFYLCLGVLYYVFAPLRACLCLSEPLTGLPWFVTDYF